MVKVLRKDLKRLTKKHLKYFCSNLGDRYVGSESNQQAADYIKENLKDIELKEQTFDCFDWYPTDLIFKVDDTEYEAQISPYSPAVELKAKLVNASNIEQLKKLKGKGEVVLLTGDLVKKQLVPKNYPFYQVEGHQTIIKLLEEKGFKAVIAATGKDQSTAGGLYPFPLIEDGDFLIPSIYTKDLIGEEIKKQVGKDVYLKIYAKKVDSKGKNVIAKVGKKNKDKIVLFAHFDSKVDSPGAIDNATGVTTLLLLIELLKDKNLDKQVEVALLNGEDYYSNPGQRVYFIENKSSLENISLGINIDGMGYKEGNTAFSVYTTDKNINDLSDKIFKNKYNMVRGDPWYQGEHTILVNRNIPALAFTSNLLEEILDKVHTEEDNLDIIDQPKVLDTAFALSEFIIEV